MSENMSELMSNKMPEFISNRMSGKMSDRPSEFTSNRMSEYVSNRMVCWGSLEVNSVSFSHCTPARCHGDPGQGEAEPG